MIELTKEQTQAIEVQKPKPLQMVNPSTREVFVLVSKEVYELTCSIVGGKQGQVWDDHTDEEFSGSRV